jgi:hypothetical protein
MKQKAARVAEFRFTPLIVVDIGYCAQEMNVNRRSHLQRVNLQKFYQKMG